MTNQSAARTQTGEVRSMTYTQVDKAREQLRLAKAAFLAVGGKPLDTAADSEVTCESLYGAASVLVYFAGQASLQGIDPTAYLQGGQTLETAAQAQGCDG